MRLTRVLLEVPWSTRPTCDLCSSRPCEAHARHLFTPPARMASAVALRDSKMLSGSGEGSARCIQCVQGSSGGRRGGVGVAGEGPHMSHGPVCHVPGPIASLEGGSGGPNYFSPPPSLGRAGEKKS